MVKTVKAAPEVVAVLERAETDGSHLRLVGELDRPTYVAVDKVLTAAGGKWNRSVKAHVFPGDAANAIREVFEVGEVTDEKRTFDVFPTPPVVAKKVIDAAEIGWGHTVLEPSCGEGGLARVAGYYAGLVICYDIRDVSGWYDGDDKYVFIQRDFTTLRPTVEFDRVVMNPPFTNLSDVKHVSHAYQFLKPGGRLVAVMSPGWQHRTGRLAEAFREWFAPRGTVLEELEAGAFRESGTMVSTLIVSIDKEG